MTGAAAEGPISTVVATMATSAVVTTIRSKLQQVPALQIDDILSTINFPPLIGFVGIILAIELWKYPTFPSSTKLVSIHLYNLLAYILNVYSTIRPGRLDGYAQQQQQQQQQQQTKSVSSNTKSNKKKKTNNNNKNTASLALSPTDYFTRQQQRSFVVPSGWAFAIWGPIFLGELLMTTVGAVVLQIKDSTNINNNKNNNHIALVSAIQQSSKSFIYAQIFQSLWATSFRPKYFATNSVFDIFISAFMLGNIAFSLDTAHKVLSAAQLNPFQYILYKLPLSLHFGWTTAATLVNINGNVAYLTSNELVTATVGIASVIVATIISVLITTTRLAPVYSCVIAWALAACSTGLNDRIHHHQQHEKQDPQERRPKSSSVSIIQSQQRLCQFGSIISACTAVSTILSRFFGSKKLLQ